MDDFGGEQVTQVYEFSTRDLVNSLGRGKTRPKGCCRSDPDGKLVAGAVLTTQGLVAGTRELSENTELVTAEGGFTKVETKDGTT